MNDRSDRCPRCGGAFHCGVNDSVPCACTSVALDARMLAELRARYDACLCLACLVELSSTKERAGPV